MDLSLTHEQSMVKSTAAEFLQQEFPKKRVRELFQSETGFAPDIWEKIRTMGWMGTIIPQVYGGRGADFTTLGVLYEELGAALCPKPPPVLGGPERSDHP